MEISNIKCYKAMGEVYPRPSNYRHVSEIQLGTIILQQQSTTGTTALYSRAQLSAMFNLRQAAATGELGISTPEIMPEMQSRQRLCDHIHS